MKISLLGFGGMGKVVQRIALERGHEVSVIVAPGAGLAGIISENRSGLHEPKNAGLPASRRPSDSETIFIGKLTTDVLKGVDVVIDFSKAEAVMENVRVCAEAGVNLVVGTTGWLDKMEEVKKLAANVGLLYSSNFSIGVNLYFKIVEAAARMMNNFDEYDIWGHEIHHCNKADSPSGTAKSLEKILLENIKRKTAVVEDKLDRKREPGEIHFSSVRGGMVNFGHTIGFDSAADRILITHEARCRDGYALGAVKAAEWLVGKKGFFGMEDFLEGLGALT